MKERNQKYFQKLGRVSNIFNTWEHFFFLKRFPAFSSPFIHLYWNCCEILSLKLSKDFGFGPVESRKIPSAPNANVEPKSRMEALNWICCSLPTSKLTIDEMFCDKASLFFNVEAPEKTVSGSDKPDAISARASKATKDLWSQSQIFGLSQCV